jgi:phosphoribosylglycinamide formyltransferase-1
MKKLNLVVLASGGGTNLQAIIDNIEAGKLNAQIKAVISNNSKAGALERARNHNIPAIHLSHKQFATPEEFDEKLLSILKENETDLLVLAGYMKMLSPTIIRAYKNRILNIHPALLPSFGGSGMYGIHVHEAVINAGVKVTGVTVHIVDEIYDHGAIVMQKTVPVLDDDTPESLAERVLKVEHQTYSEALQLFAEGKVEIKDNKAFIKNLEY